MLKTTPLTNPLVVIISGCYYGLLLKNIVHADNEISCLKRLHRSYSQWKPRGIVDVGANKGQWTYKMQKNVFPQDWQIPTFMVEASPEHKEELEAIKKECSPFVDYEIAVLSEKDGDKVDFYGFGGTGDSMFRENTKFYDGHKPVIRDTVTLDSLVDHMNYIDYLKLDVQGAELVVLGGANKTLERVTFVQLEISVIEYNEGGACWFELDDLLRKHGFYFYDSDDYNRNSLFITKGLGQFDVLYVKPTSDYLPPILKSKKPRFCGANRAKNVNQKVKKENLSISVNYELTSASTPMFYILATFLAGFLTGCIMMKIGSKRKISKDE